MQESRVLRVHGWLQLSVFHSTLAVMSAESVARWNAIPMMRPEQNEEDQSGVSMLLKVLCHIYWRP